LLIEVPRELAKAEITWIKTTLYIYVIEGGAAGADYKQRTDPLDMPPSTPIHVCR